MRPEDTRADNKRPFTGEEYLKSLRDGREIYIDGELVRDVTVHPAFRNSARSIARLYDALHDPQSRDVLTAPTDTGSGGYTHRYFKPARSREDTIAQQQAIAQCLANGPHHLEGVGHGHGDLGDADAALRQRLAHL